MSQNKNTDIRIVFSKWEAKKYSKLENCISDHEKAYHDKLSESPDSIGKFLYSYVTDDPYVVRKREKGLLIRRCPVPHIRKGKLGSRYSIDGTKSSMINSDGELSLDLASDLSEADSIDFDEPVSSSTPKTKRKQEKGNMEKAAEEKAKSERKQLQKKEKEQRDLEKKKKRLQEAKEKKERNEEKKRQQREAEKAEESKKVKAVDEKEKERKEEYMRKYRYSKRPSLPLGARLRVVQLTPSPRRLTRKQKSRITSRSSEFSTDYPEDDKESNEGGGGSKREDLKVKRRNEEYQDRGDRESDSENLTLYRRGSIDKIRASRKVGNEFSRAELIETGGTRTSKGSTTVASKGQRKFCDRFGYKNSKTMFIMASVPHATGRSREVVVCMVKSLPQQGVVVFKPDLGYRNVEAKRNHVYRISSELYKDEALDYSFTRDYTGGGYSSRKPKGIDDFIGFFELVPKNELRLTVMGEITTVQGFDSSPLSVYYVVDIPKGWRNESILSNTEGITHNCYTDDNSVGHFSHAFAFHLTFSKDSVEDANSYPTPVIAFMVVSMEHPSPRIIYEGYGYLNIPMTPGSHFITVRTWKPRPRTTVEKLRSAFLDITPSLQDMKFAHIPHSEYEEFSKANLLGLQTDPSGSVKFRLHVIHQTPIFFKESENKKLDLLEKMSSATILKSVQAVIEAFQRAREKAASLKNHQN